MEINPEIQIVSMFYNEIDALPRFIDSVEQTGYNKQILFFDGPFDGFEKKFECSTDGSIEYIKKRGHEVIPCGRMPHILKQNFRLKEAAKHSDVILNMDCDEYIVGDWKTFQKTFETIHGYRKNQVYNIPWFDQDGHYVGRNFMRKLIVSPGELNFSGRHWFLFKKDFRVEPKYLVGGIQIFHDSTIRPDLREEKMNKFQRWYTEEEERAYRASKDNMIPLPEIKAYPCGCHFGYIYYLEGDKKKARDISRVCRKHQ